jgi:hypothetical protein
MGTQAMQAQLWAGALLASNKSANKTFVAIGRKNGICFESHDTYN